MTRLNGLLIFAFYWATVQTSSAATVFEGESFFDFESSTPTYDVRIHPSRLGQLSSLTIETSLHTVSISRSGIGFDLSKNVSGQAKPEVFGEVSLETFFDQRDTPFIVNISPPVQQFGLTWGDYDGIPDLPEDNDALTLNAYSGPDGAGSLVASTTEFLSNEEFDEENAIGFSFDTAEVRADSISSVVLIGGSQQFPHSLFYDNFQLNNVPEVTGSNRYLLVLFISIIHFRRRLRLRQQA